jgi:hypothetical protein
MNGTLGEPGNPSTTWLWLPSKSAPICWFAPLAISEKVPGVKTLRFDGWKVTVADATIVVVVGGRDVEVVVVDGRDVVVGGREVVVVDGREVVVVEGREVEVVVVACRVVDVVVLVRRVVDVVLVTAVVVVVVVLGAKVSLTRKRSGLRAISAPVAPPASRSARTTKPLVAAAGTSTLSASGETTVNAAASRWKRPRWKSTR